MAGYRFIFGLNDLHKMVTKRFYSVQNYISIRRKYEKRGLSNVLYAVLSTAARCRTESDFLPFKIRRDLRFHLVLIFKGA